MERYVRANPAYRLVPLGSMPDTQLRTLADLGVHRGTAFGVLVAAARSGLPDKVVDADGADLFVSLRRPGPVPLPVAGQLAGLVMDGVLEVASEDGFVSGPAAHEAVLGPGEAGPPRDRLGRLSRAALSYAERLMLADASTLTARLYCYHRVPLSPRWSRAYPDAAAVRDLLRSPALSRHWTGPIGGDDPAGYLAWARRGDRCDADPAGFPYKLYVSPRMDALPEVLPVLAGALTDAGASRFKVGAGALGLLRPDKIVVHLGGAGELEDVAGALAAALAGAPAHGVPFSAELAGDGLLSWGGDPPADAGPLGGEIESWRLSVCRRLAESLAAAGAAGLRPPRQAEFALARLAADGVDVCSFSPAGLAPPGPP